MRLPYTEDALINSRTILEEAAFRPNPDDPYFQRVGFPMDTTAQLCNALPHRLRDRLDPHSLELQPGSYVSDDLRTRYSDMLYKARLAERDVYLYLLIQNRGRAERLTPLQILSHVERLWTRHLDEHRDARTVPAVIPLVVLGNHRGDRWSAPTDPAATPASDSGIRGYLPLFRFLFDDSHPIDLAGLKESDLTPAPLVTLVLGEPAHEFGPVDTTLQQMIDELRDAPFDPSVNCAFGPMITYILRVGEASVAELIATFEEVPAAKEVLMAVADRLIAQGETKGRIEGRIAGRAEGRAETLIEQMQLKFGPIPERVITAVQTADTTQLKTCAARILTAETLTELILP
ncbi:hypothetical protein D5S18_24220 [Nocardia panacis]|uniref:Transposase (putative) YhgA-like domain-containing protein n=1 Tax=Nocardia panacis TaxID=2340916 RepID=A0A3A4K2V9_9NOCA|nr:Rpn family recombination-promoting nuclease/putative transposase [Nocardia panacis]RJO72264.1 hypothetical protein D5S18_24220 [Nocardia panacis]